VQLRCVGGGLDCADAGAGECGLQRRRQI
jgi:hypothetical protein